MLSCYISILVFERKKSTGNIPTLVCVSFLGDGQRRCRWNFECSSLSEQLQLSSIAILLMQLQSSHTRGMGWGGRVHQRDGGGLGECLVFPETHKAPVVKDWTKVWAVKTWFLCHCFEQINLADSWSHGLFIKMLSFEFFSCHHIHNKVCTPPIPTKWSVSQNKEN